MPIARCRVTCVSRHFGRLIAPALFALAPIVSAHAQNILYAWGSNVYGQLGDGTTVNRSTPTPVTGLTGVSIPSIAGGAYYSLALSTNGQVYSWGYNYFGQLGDGTTTSRLSPTPVTGLTGVHVASVVGGGGHSVAMSTSGQFYAWGYNGFGQLGDGTFTNRSTPTPVTGLTGIPIASVAGGSSHSLALSIDGQVYAWGSNITGQLGDGTLNYRSTPAPVTGLTGIPIASVSGGSYYSLALSTTGQVYAWGWNGDGELGDGTNTNRLSVTPVNGLTGVSIASVAGGYNHSLAVSTTGQVYAWGDNGSGELGDGTTTSHSTPNLVSALNGLDIVDVEATLHSSFALSADGRLFSWGYNAHGQLGVGDFNDRLLPTEVLAPNGYKFGSIAVGDQHVLALLTPIPAPASASILVIGGLLAARRRR